MWRDDFPLIRNGTCIYLDNAATTQKPDCVLAAVNGVYETCNANVHRSPHRLGRQMTKRYEEARQSLAGFFGADERYTTVFTRGTTEAVNLVASSVLPYLFDRDAGRREVVVTAAEHHSNFVVWQQWCRRLGGRFRVLPLLPDGQPDLAALRQLLSEKTALLATAHLTNVFGSRFPVEEMTQMAHEVGAGVLLDGAQAAGHLPVNLAELDCDFYCVSGHKMYGPNGIGLLFGKKELLEKAEPWQYGGEMIDCVREDETTFAALPYRLEAGTPNYVGAVGLAAAAAYLNGLGGMDCVAQREAQLYEELVRELRQRRKIRLPVPHTHSCGIVSFLAEGMHPFDTAALLDAQGIAVRCGSHCAQPLLRCLGLTDGTVRISLGLYNTKQDMELLLAALDRILERKRPIV